jgi:hypothetical protein
MIVIALMAAVALVASGIIATQINGNDTTTTPVGAVATATTGVLAAGTQGGNPDNSAIETPTAPSQLTGQPSDDATATPAGEVSNVPVGEPQPTVLPAHHPVRGAPINGIQAVEDYYSEWYQFDNFIVAWRPGAFPPERAEQVAAQARIALDHVNRQLGTNDYGRIEILLADEMYLEKDCVGCQGYAFSDFRQVFILQDGSMADDEFQALLTHEIGHVIAGDHIALPHVATLFLAEGLATWLMTPDLVAQGYIEPRQIAAWAWKMGIIPPIFELRKAKFEGRTGARAEYDPAASFSQYVIETYGMEGYKRIYDGELPDDAMGRTYEQLEQEWHGWLAAWADNTVNGVTAEAWWGAAQVVTRGFEVLYADPSSVTQEQYAQLATARVALNRGELEHSLALMEASGLAARTAN